MLTFPYIMYGWYGTARGHAMEWKRAQRKRERKHSNLYSKDTINIFMCATTVAPHRKGLSTYKWSIECRQIYDQNNICMRVCELRICERVWEYFCFRQAHTQHPSITYNPSSSLSSYSTTLFYCCCLRGCRAAFILLVCGGSSRHICNVLYIYVYILAHTIEETHNAHDTTHQNK